MSSVFILRNQHGLFISRQGEWVSGREATGLFRTSHKDQAINEMFEVSAKDHQQRVEILSVSTNDKGIPALPADWIVDLPEPQLALADAVNDGSDAAQAPGVDATIEQTA